MKRKVIAIIAIVVVLLLVVALSAAAATKQSKIKELKKEVTELTMKADSLSEEVQFLGAMDVIRVNVTFTLNQKNVASINFGNYQNIAKEVASITRRELLDSLRYNPIAYEAARASTSE